MGDAMVDDVKPVLAKVPAVTVVGATLPGFPQVGLAPFQTEKNAAIYMAKQAKKPSPVSVRISEPGEERISLRKTLSCRWSASA